MSEVRRERNKDYKNEGLMLYIYIGKRWKKEKRQETDWRRRKRETRDIGNKTWGETVLPLSRQDNRRLRAAFVIPPPPQPKGPGARILPPLKPFTPVSNYTSRDHSSPYSLISRLSCHCRFEIHSDETMWEGGKIPEIPSSSDKLSLRDLQLVHLPYHSPRILMNRQTRWIFETCSQSFLEWK